MPLERLKSSRPQIGEAGAPDVAYRVMESNLATYASNGKMLNAIAAGFEVQRQIPGTVGV